MTARQATADRAQLINCVGQCPLSGGKANIEAKLLTNDEARRIAANVAKLPELVRR